MDIGELVKQLAPYLELIQALSFVATIILTAVSIYALKQLRIAKDSLETQSLRDAKKLSTEHIYRYLDRIINNDEYDIHLSKEAGDTLKSFKYDADSDEDGLDIAAIKDIDSSIQLESKEDRLKYISSVEKIVSEFWPVLNELEAFAAVVTSGVLDDETVYRAIGSDYVNKIQSSHFDQFLSYYAETEDDYVNLLELYELWNARLIVSKSEKQLMKVEKDNKEIADRIVALKEEVRRVQPRTIQSIGVEDKKTK